MLSADVEVDRRDFAVRAALSVAAGERVALFGPSGAGKTTVLEAIAGLVPIRHGQIELAGRMLTSPGAAVPPWRRRVGLLRQDPGLFPHLSVRANLTYARSARAGELPGMWEYRGRQARAALAGRRWHAAPACRPCRWATAVSGTRPRIALAPYRQQVAFGSRCRVQCW